MLMNVDLHEHQPERTSLATPGVARCWFKSSNETRIYYHAPRQRYRLLDAI